ncbi:MAG: DegT/DnrJ/EryC1/StrS aminotransferase family protein [Methanoregulaceae archaeon]|nr:DegT/DnrJ/EryC1/StrS aminotransferase family protein [Methanoregulaceae archaeon]
MRVPFYDIKAQYLELQEELDRITHEVLSSGAYAPGKYVQALEQEVASQHGCKHGIAVNSGTDALRILMDAAGIGAGDEVITTAFTFVASVETIVQTGATPVFVDIDPVMMQIDPSLIETAITPRTKAILPIHLFGQLCPIRKVQAIAERYGLTILEDAAQALHSHHKGTYAGNFGRGAGISFYVTKNLGAAGDGGMIITNDDEIAERSRSMRVHGMGRERYYYDYLGYTSRLDEIQGAILLTKLSRVPAWNDRRGELAAIYHEVLKGTKGLALPQLLHGNNTTNHQFTVQLDRRDELQAFLREREIDSMIYYPVPIHFHAPYQHLAERGSLPVTERVSSRVLSLPIHPHLSDEQVRHAAETIRSFF